MYHNIVVLMEIYCRLKINRLSYHTTGWLLLDYKMWIYIIACSQCPWPASQNGFDVWIYVISQPFLTSWAVGADLLMSHEWTFKLCFSSATHKVVVICHLLCIISQPALMSGTQSHAQPAGAAVFSLSLNLYWIMIEGIKF